MPSRISWKKQLIARLIMRLIYALFLSLEKLKHTQTVS